jgi:hypothetical protein
MRAGGRFAHRKPSISLNPDLGCSNNWEWPAHHCRNDPPLARREAQACEDVVFAPRASRICDNPGAYASMGICFSGITQNRIAANHLSSPAEFTKRAAAHY